MRTGRLRATLAVWLLGGAGMFPPSVALAQGTQALPMPCLQIVDAGVVKAVLGGGLTLAGAAMSRPGESTCSWVEMNDKPRRLSVTFVDKRGLPAATPTVAGTFDARIAALVKAGLKGEPVAGLGEQATLFALGDSSLLLVRRADGVLLLGVTNMVPAQMIAVARRAVAAPSPSLGTHATFPAVPAVPPAPVAATPAELTAEQRVLPCVRALTTVQVRSIKRTEVLAELVHPRSGYSACEWRATTDRETGFTVVVATRDEFAAGRLANAAAYVAAERKLLEMYKPEPIAGLGDEAFVTTQIGQVILVRKGAEALIVNCQQCSRDQLLAIARLIVPKLGTLGTAFDALRGEPARGVQVPCLQVLDGKAVSAVVGRNLEVVSSAVTTGWSDCSWWAGEGQATSIPLTLVFFDQRAFLNKLLFPGAASSAAGLFAFEVGMRTQAGMKAEPIGALGQRAVLFTHDKLLELFVLRDDGVMRLSGTLPRQQLRAIADRAAAAPAPTLGREVSFPEPGRAAPAMPIELDAEKRSLPCVQLLTAGEVTGSKRAEVLVQAQTNRPGYSLCEWRSTTQTGTGFMVSVATAEEFKQRGLSGAAAYFAAEHKAMTVPFKPEPLHGLGTEAIQADASRQAVVMVRTGETVITVTCFECSRLDAISLARLAAVAK